MRSGSLNGAGPHPDLMHVPGDAKPNKDSAFRPRGRNGFDELFDPVLPDDPCAHPLWRIGGGDRQIYQLLRLEAPGLTLGEATLVDHESSLSNTCPMPLSVDAFSVWTFRRRRVATRLSDIRGYLIHMNLHSPSAALERLGPLPALIFDALSEGVRVSAALHATHVWRIAADRHFYRHAIRRQAMELLKPYGLDLGDHDNLGLGMSGLILRLDSGDILRVWHSSDGELPLAESEPMRMFCTQGPTSQGRMFLELPGIEDSDGSNLAILWDDDGSALTRFELLRPCGLDGKRVLVDWSRNLLSCHGEREADLDYGVEDDGRAAGLEG